MENQKRLDSFGVEIHAKPPYNNERLQERFDRAQLIIGFDEIVYMKEPFCPDCGSKNHVKFGTRQKPTTDIIGNIYYFNIQRYLCKRCGRVYSANVTNITIYDETELYDEVIEDLTQRISNQIKTNDEIYQLGAEIFNLLQ